MQIGTGAISYAGLATRVVYKVLVCVCVCVLGTGTSPSVACSLLMVREAQTYASQILRADFGEVVEKVATRLLVHGPAGLKDLGRALQLPLAQLKNSLLVLIQQNIVECIPKVDNAKGVRDGKEVVYKALLEQVLVRPWFPRMLVTARELFGTDAVLLLEQLFICGRLTIEDMLQHAAAKYAQEQNMRPGDKDDSAKRLALHAAASQLQARDALAIRPCTARARAPAGCPHDGRRRRWILPAEACPIPSRATGLPVHLPLGDLACRADGRQQ